MEVRYPGGAGQVVLAQRQDVEEVANHHPQGDPDERSDWLVAKIFVNHYVFQEKLS